MQTEERKKISQDLRQGQPKASRSNRAHAGKPHAQATMDKVMTLSAYHLPEESIEWMERASGAKCACKMNDYEWILQINTQDMKQWMASVPKPIAKIGQFAIKHGCGWICFDRDAEPLDMLHTYVW